MTLRPRHWAVLVGIDFYFEEERRLNGAVNDVQMAEVYLSNFKLHSLAKFIAVDQKISAQSKPDGCASLWPTYKNIAGEFKRIAEVASPGDLVYFHYSGHGSLSPTTALEYNEDFGSDAALVLYDENGKDFVRYMRGIELAGLLDKMVEKGLKLTVILDCCYAGALSRGNDVSVRGIPWDNDVALAYPPEYPSVSASGSIQRDLRDASISQHWLIRPRDYTLLAACGSNEIATECRGNDGRSHGSLSYFLYRCLFKALVNNVEIVLNNIYRQLCAELHVALPQQHPMLFGNDELAFFTPSDKVQPRKPFASVIKILSSRKIWLSVGLAHGVCLDDTYELYQLHEDQNSVDSKRALYSVTAVHEFHSDAEQVQEPPDGVSITKGWYASLYRVAQPTAQVTLGPDIKSALSSLVEDSSWLDLVDTVEIRPDSLPSFRVVKTEERYSILTNTGAEVPNMPLLTTDSTYTLKRVVLALEHLAKFASIENSGMEDLNFADQSNPSMPFRSMPKGAEIADHHGEYSIHLQSKDYPGKPIIGGTASVLDGEKISVTFKNHSTHSLYLTIFDMQPLCAVVKIYPSSDRGYYREIPAKSKEFKGKISFTMRMSIPEDLKKDGTPEVEDVLKFFITTRPTGSSFETMILPELSKAMGGRQHTDSDYALYRFLHDKRTAMRRLSETGQAGTRGNDRWACQNVIIRTVAR